MSSPRARCQRRQRCPGRRKCRPRPRPRRFIDGEVSTCLHSVSATPCRCTSGFIRRRGSRVREHVGPHLVVQPQRQAPLSGSVAGTGGMVMVIIIVKRDDGEDEDEREDGGDEGDGVATWVEFLRKGLGFSRGNEAHHNGNGDKFEGGGGVITKERVAAAWCVPFDETSRYIPTHCSALSRNHNCSPAAKNAAACLPQTEEKAATRIEANLESSQNRRLEPNLKSSQKRRLEPNLELNQKRRIEPNLESNRFGTDPSNSFDKRIPLARQTIIRSLRGL